jgi:hypothetical protein
VGEAFLDIGEKDPAVALGELTERSKVLLIDDVLDDGAKGPMAIPAEEREDLAPEEAGRLLSGGVRARGGCRALRGPGLHRRIVGGRDLHSSLAPR